VSDVSGFTVAAVIRRCVVCATATGTVNQLFSHTHSQFRSVQALESFGFNSLSKFQKFQLELLGDHNHFSESDWKKES
jgi:hypothetical protein